MHIDDVARIHVEALNETKLPTAADFLLMSPNDWSETSEIATKLFPSEVENGVLKLNGKRSNVDVKMDNSETVKVFGELKGFDEMIKSLVGQYLELRRAE